jgi:hypothetical protein
MLFITCKIKVKTACIKSVTQAPLRFLILLSLYLHPLLLHQRQLTSISLFNKGARAAAETPALWLVALLALLTKLLCMRGM